jgi:hypothetical protein
VDHHIASRPLDLGDKERAGRRSIVSERPRYVVGIKMALASFVDTDAMHPELNCHLELL